MRLFRSARPVRIAFGCRSAVALRCVALIAIVSLLAASRAAAQLPTPTLTRVFPPGGQQGTEVEVTISGANLEETRQLLFSHEGIAAKPKMAPPTAFRKEPKPIDNKFVVTIAADVPPGVYECRSVGLYGVSNPRGFAVGDRPEVNETGKNTSLTDAMEVELGSTINGQTGNDSFDTYKFSAKQGQRILVDCAAHRIDSRMDGTIALFNAAGEQIGFARDSNRFDPLLDFTAPTDGEYTVKVYDFTYRGGAEYFYRLSIHTGPYLDFIFPPAGTPGSKNQYTLYGRNLPGGEATDLVTAGGAPLDQLKVEVQLPAEIDKRRQATGGLFEPRDVGIDGYEYRLETPEGTSNPVLIGFATAPPVSEKEPNNESTAAQELNPPCEIAGQFYPQRDSDWFQFDAQKGDEYWIEVISQRLGLSTDPFLLVQKVKVNEEGEESVSDVSESDDYDPKFGNPTFDRPTSDPQYRFSVPEDGTYRILVRDLFGGNGSYPQHVYRLSVRKAEPDFRLVATLRWIHEKDKNKLLTWHPVLRKGGTAAIEVQVYARDGFKEPITLEADGLPEKVTCPSVTVGPGQKKAVLLLGAAEDAPTWTGPIKIVGKAKLDEKEIVREASGSCVMWDKANQNDYTFARMTRNIVLSVVEDKAPVRAEWASERKVDTARAGKVSLNLKVAREEGVKGDLKLDPQGLPKEIKAGSVTVKNDAGEGKLDITVDPKAKPGTYTLYLVGTSKFPFRRNPQAVKRAEEAKKNIDEVIQQLTEENKKAQEALKAAQKAVADAKNAVNAAKDDGAKTAAAAKQKEAEDALAKAGAAAKKAEADLKAAQDEQKRLDKEVKDLTNAAKPKDLDVYAQTLPVTLHVLPAPIELASAAPSGAVKQGAQGEIAVSVKRLLGYEDPIELTAGLPKNVKGVSIGKASLGKGQSDGKLEVKANEQATPGTHQVTISATVKYNGQNLKVEQNVPLQVEAVKKEEKK